MHLHWVDWLVILAYGVFALWVGLMFSGRAGRNIGEFFVGGRSFKWWIAGTSIVATSFAADTPLAVSGFIRHGGIYENWIWWSVAFGGMITVFFFARLWRRAGVITDVEFIELRYEGRPARALRAFMAVYGGIFTNCVTMGWVIVAMMKIIDVMLGWDKTTSIAVCLILAVAYTAMSGFWGVVVTDFIQFIIAMVGSIALAGILLWKLGGPAGMVEAVQQTPAFDPKVFHLIPDFSTAGKLVVVTFVVQLTIWWWSQAQGHGYVAQRLFSTPSERDSALAALWFNFAHYVLRPWPWIVVGLASIVFLPLAAGQDPEAAYPMMIRNHLPVGLRGLMVASLLAAFMSTMDTQLNWGASYLVNDIYKRFIRPGASSRHYVAASRVAVVLLAIFGAVAAWQTESIAGGWVYFSKITVGAGMVGMLRWYWWRVNPWSEISALAGSFVMANGGFWMPWLNRIGLLPDRFMPAINRLYSPDAYAPCLVVIVLTVTIIWIVATFVTRPVSDAHLTRFFRRVRPGGWWAHIARANPDVVVMPARRNWLGWLAGVACIYTGLFGVGHLCLARPLSGMAFLAVSAVTGWYMVRVAAQQGEPLREELAPAEEEG